MELIFLVVEATAAEVDPSLSTFPAKDLLPLFVLVDEGLLARDTGGRDFRGDRQPFAFIVTEYSKENFWPPR